MRNILIHAYDDVMLEEVWVVATQSIPKLANQLQKIVIK